MFFSLSSQKCICNENTHYSKFMEIIKILSFGRNLPLPPPNNRFPNSISTIFPLLYQLFFHYYMNYFSTTISTIFPLLYQLFFQYNISYFSTTISAIFPLLYHYFSTSISTIFPLLYQQKFTLYCKLTCFQLQLPLLKSCLEEQNCFVFLM